MFGDMLNQHSRIGFHGEEVAHLRDQGWSAQAAWIDSLFADPPALCDERLSGREQLRAVGFKVKLREVASAEGLRTTLLQHRARVIHMTRRNIVKQAVSSVRAIDMYKKRGRYNLVPGEEPLLPGCYPIPVRRFERILLWLEEHVEKLAGFVADLPLPVLEIRYEDVVADPSVALGDVCGWLGLEYEPLRCRRIKLTPDDLAAAVSNIAELERRYRGTRFERFFSDDRVVAG